MPTHARTTQEPSLVTTHRLIAADARDLPSVETESVDLVVTSPPYPMIEMWDAAFCAQDPGVTAALEANRAEEAYERMHAILDKVWAGCACALKPGGIACINIGDATRSSGGEFRLFTNHSRITASLESLGLSSLPPVIWRKTTNAPNKFMGSGMYPAGAYVTLEHEYILIFRKGGKRRFSDEDRERRRRSAYFWEERNSWFTDLWSLPGARQERKRQQRPGGAGAPEADGQGELFADDLPARSLTALLDSTPRARSAAFPLEVPLRLILMYSAEGDTVLDPFTGTGTSQVAALSAGRSSIGIDRDPAFLEIARNALLASRETALGLAARRVAAHRAFAAASDKAGRPLAYRNLHHGFPVRTRQEMRLLLRSVSTVEESEGLIRARY